MRQKLFGLLSFIYGLFFFTGYGKAYGYLEGIMKGAHFPVATGLMWLAAGSLIILCALLFAGGIKKALLPLFITALLSQILIIEYWQYCGFISFLNAFVVCCSGAMLGGYHFENSMSRKAKKLLSAAGSHHMMISAEMAATLPPPVHRWIIYSGITGKKNMRFIKLEQKGMIKLKPSGDWKAFNATEYFDTKKPAFLWYVTVFFNSFFTIKGMDKFAAGIGEMKIKLFGIFNLAVAKPCYKTNTASMVRYLAESVWFPSFALSKYVTWEAIDDTSARMEMMYADLHVSGIVKFSATGGPELFTAERYMTATDKSTPQIWEAAMEDYKVFDGVLVPSKISITWKLQEGDFLWNTTELVALKYCEGAPPVEVVL